MKKTETIDITPEWKGVLRLLLELYGSKKQDAKQYAWIELSRMADAADKYNIFVDKKTGKVKKK